MEAKFIVLEGIDGAGTTTQGARLRDAFINSGRRVVLTCEPTDGPVGSIIRRVLRGKLKLHTGGQDESGEEALLALMFAADRLDHSLNLIEPALREGTHVVSDRYYLSSFAYQSTHCDLAWVRELNSRCRRPDITFLLDADPEMCLERIGKARVGLERYETLERLNLIRKNYLDIAAILRAGEEKIIQLDAAQPIEQTHKQIMQHLEIL